VADTSSRLLRGVSNHWLHDAKGAPYACISGNPSCICRAFNASISGNPTRLPSQDTQSDPLGPLLSPSRAQSSDISTTTFVKWTAATVAVSLSLVGAPSTAPPLTTFFFNHINSHGVRYGTVRAVPDPELFPCLSLLRQRTYSRSTLTHWVVSSLSGTSSHDVQQFALHSFTCCLPQLKT
jgi:hypothetical protein